MFYGGDLSLYCEILGFASYIVWHGREPHKLQLIYFNMAWEKSSRIAALLNYVVVWHGVCILMNVSSYVLLPPHDTY